MLATVAADGGNDRLRRLRLRDAGAQGIGVPHVRSKTEAELIVLPAATILWAIEASAAGERPDSEPSH